MNKQKKEEKPTTLLAIDPTVRGFGYMVFDGIKELTEWGKAEIRIQKNRRCLARIKKLINFHEPDVIVIEDPQNSYRRKRTLELIKSIEQIARAGGIKVRKYSRNQVQDVFVQFGASTKYEIAKKIAQWYPELEFRLPTKRKPWQAEDERYGIFDATALGLTYFYVEE